jgi:hypothetical protein
MSSTDTHDLVQRVASLEREMALMRRRCFQAIGLMAVISVSVNVSTTVRAQRGPQTVTAPFVVQDESGNVVMEVEGSGPGRGLHVFRGGSPSPHASDATISLFSEGAISLQDEHGAGINLTTKDGPRLFVYSDTFKKTHFDVTPTQVIVGTGSLVVQDPADKHQVASLSKNGSLLTGTLNVADANRATIMRVQDVAPKLDASGKPVKDADGKDQKIGRGLYVFNAAQKPIAQVFAGDEGGGRVKALSPNEKDEAILGALDKNFGLVLRSDHNVRGWLTVVMGRPEVGFTNDNNVQVGSLQVGASGGGKLQLGDAAGDAMVEAGTTAGGVGLVRTFPLGSPGGGLLGLPGTFIIGIKRGGGHER